MHYFLIVATTVALFGGVQSMAINQAIIATTCSSMDMATQCIVDTVSEGVNGLTGTIYAAMLSEKLDLLSAKLDTLISQQTTETTPVNAPNLPENCADIQTAGNTVSQVYTIYETSPFAGANRRSMQVYCDLDPANDGGEWLVIQRRRDGSQDFSQTWSTYRDGFGDLSNEFWLGNDNIAIITGSSLTYELRIELEDWNGQSKYAHYSSFRISGEQLEYELDIGTFSGTAGDSLSRVNGYKFSTYDRDNDIYIGECARQYNMAGFWYRDCGYAYLNNPYSHTSGVTAFKGISWRTWLGNSYSLKATEMKIRPRRS